MKEFSTVDLLRDFKEVSLAANRRPVAITQHRKPRYVLMSYDDFQRIQERDPRRAYLVDETPPELAALLLPELDRLIAEGKSDD
jgi:prevent-host-death family protein